MRDSVFQAIVAIFKAMMHRSDNLKSLQTYILIATNWMNTILIIA
jgi:hypothetical protein